MDTQKLIIKSMAKKIDKNLSSFDPINKKKNKDTGKRRKRKTGKVKKKTQKYLDLDKYFLYLPRSKKNTKNKFFHFPKKQEENLK